jgi:hypothetical protein
MSEWITLELPAELVRQARELAAATNRALEDAVADWIGRAVADPPVESLPDAHLLALCDSRLSDTEQDELSELLARNRENELTAADRPRLDGLLAAYRRGLIVKGRAVKEAMSRGLTPRSVPGIDTPLERAHAGFRLASPADAAKFEMKVTWGEES